MPVVDASVALKWFVEEPGSAEAHRLLEAHGSGEAPLVAPDLLVYEVANVLLYRPIFSAGEVARSIERLYALELELLTPSVEVVTAAVALAGARRLSFYDALYVRLAQHLNLPFYTADRKLMAKLTDFRFIKSV